MSGVVTVGDDNTPPSIAVVRDTATPAAGSPVAFHAGASDPERLPLRIDWDMDGDGSFERVGAGASVSATYDPGSRTVRAQAVDDVGATAVAAHTFTVPGGGGSSPPPPPPGESPLPYDTLPPAVSVSAPRALTTTRLRRRGVRVRLTPAEHGRLVVQLRTRSGRRLARAAADAHAGEETALRLRPGRVSPGRLTLRVVAVDVAGNRTTMRRFLRATRAN